MNCKQPDRDAPGMKCGYPLPCPWHTAVLDVAAQTATIPSHGDPSELATRRLREIGRVLRERTERGKYKGERTDLKYEPKARRKYKAVPALARAHAASRRRK